MRRKSILAATGVLLAALAAFAAAPASAQGAAGTPVCANCHELAHKSTQLTAHGARNDADGTGLCQ